MYKIVALVGMCGAGKSVVAEKFTAAGFKYLRFGQIVIDEIRAQDLPINEENERVIREGFRKQHGMAAFAILNIPRIDELLTQAPVIVDGLYSWAEYKVLKGKYGDNLVVVAVYASPSTRYKRLEARNTKIQEDPSVKYRPITASQAKSRDFAEIENSDKGGPIAMANFTIINEGTLEELHEKVASLLTQIQRLE